jgi:hypothetical protein
MAETESIGSKFVRDYGGFIVCACNALAATLIWLGYVSDGFSSQAILDGVYEIQAASLARGSLVITPGPLEVFYYDAIMYWGSYYFYWGLLPSAAFLALELSIGRIAAHYTIVFAAFFSIIFFLQLFIVEILESSGVEDSPSGWSLYGGSSILTWLLLFVLPYPAERGWFFGRFVVYEQQILFGLAFALPGLYCAVKGIKEKSTAYMAVRAADTLRAGIRLAGSLLRRQGHQREEHCLYGRCCSPLFAGGMDTRHLVSVRVDNVGRLLHPHCEMV